MRMRDDAMNRIRPEPVTGQDLLDATLAVVDHGAGSSGPGLKNSRVALVFDMRHQIVLRPDNGNRSGRESLYDRQMRPQFRAKYLRPVEMEYLPFLAKILDVPMLERWRKIVGIVAWRQGGPVNHAVRQFVIDRPVVVVSMMRSK